MTDAVPADACMPLADIGVNLTDRRFGTDLDQVLSRAQEAGVKVQIVTGTDIRSSRDALALVEHREGLWSTTGLHPHQAKAFSADMIGELADLAAHPKVRAIGETGLDFNRDFSPRPDQERAFAAQLDLAVRLGLPVFLHQRDAHERFLPILREFRDALPDAVVHCFTGSRRELFDYLDLDCHIGVTGWVCDERRGLELQRLVPNIPLDRLLVETDSPYLLPRNMPGKPPVSGRNEPALLPWVVQKVAECRDQTEEVIARHTWENTRRFFRLDA